MRNKRKDGKIPCMVVTEKQYLEDLQKPLIKMGMRFYEMYGLDTFPLLVINASGILGKITNLPIKSSGERNRFLIEPYNAKLFLKEVRKCVYGEDEELNDIPRITEADLIGDLKGFPIEVVQKMVEEQVRQGNKADITVFKKYAGACHANNGFTWDNSKDGFEFWEKIVNSNAFGLFFEKYPKEKIEQKAETKESNSEYPKMMLVRDTDKDDWVERIVICNIKDRFITLEPEIDLDEFKSDLESNILTYSIQSWSQCRKITKTMTLTKQQIADKFGIDVEDLIIK